MVCCSMALQRVVCLALVLCHGVSSSPLDAATAGPAAAAVQNAAPRKLKGRFLHITDLHPDSFYKPHSSTDEKNACHRGTGSAGYYGSEVSDCDSPHTLVNATFDWIAKNIRDEIDFVVWTGDSARHDSDEKIPRNQDQVLNSNRYVASKFLDLFADVTASTGMAVPVIPTFGNNDILPHNILLPGPNRWLQYYTDIWRRFIPEEQRHSFEFGGWFYVEVIPNHLAVFSLNSLYFFDRNAGVDGCANPVEPGYKQFEWLRVQLQFMRERGMKAILMGHVPPARTESKQLWDEACWQKYTIWLQQYRDVIVSGLFGHMNIDHFLLQDTKDIDLSLLSDAPEHKVSTREYMQDELSVESATDYLHELRQRWSKLEPPMNISPGKSGKVGEDKKSRKKKGRKPKKNKDPWGERYSLSLVGPSIVPTYFPTLRVFEYNITGLENAALWRDSLGRVDMMVQDDAQRHLDLRDGVWEDSRPVAESAKKKQPKHKKPKDKNPKKKPTKPKDPNFKMPEPPSKSSPPGPAYSAQPLTLVGYTQYFANLTFINNLTFEDTSSSAPALEAESEEFSILESFADWLLRWRQGKQGNKKPRSPNKPHPREFQFEVEYSTFDDKIYKLGDLTVNSFVQLAYRMGQQTRGKKSAAKFTDLIEVNGTEYHDEEVMELEDEMENDGDSDEDSDDESEEEEEDDDFDAEKESDDKKPKKGKGGKGDKGKKKKGKKKKKAKKINKTWLHFLDHAFVETLEKKELKKFAKKW
ncbi:Metallo-dependent phosphatase-like protein [Rhypophila decipiens]|uniref:Endopolyphosphatase n=1 Tax=Rhypophila decipiens TaxID=261697 RepID=A0AAN6Y3V5_9PEZI|nr:Metallo-dependent phosphatase-like protein [Rhypophila decipiens]